MLRRRLFISNFIYKVFCDAKNLLSGIPKITPIDVELLDYGLWWWSALNLRLKNPSKVFSTSNWNLGGSSDGRQPPCLKMAAATFFTFKILTFFTLDLWSDFDALKNPVWKWLQQHFWHFSHWNSVHCSKCFGLVLMLSKIVQKFVVKAHWVLQNGNLPIFPTTRLWLMISDQLHCFRSIKSAQHGDKKSQHCREKLAESLFAVNYLQTACTLFFELSFFKSQVINARDCSTCYPSDKALPTIGPLGTWRLRGNGRTCCCSL